jgi:lipopolysaccharide transport system permease protein
MCFSQSLSRISLSLAGSGTLISKIYFPRLLIPLAALATPLLDFLLSFSLFLVLMGAYGVAPSGLIVLVPLFLALGLLAAFAFGLWLSAANVRYRDVGAAIPIALQLGVYASPIVYPLSLVPGHWRFLYSLNPLVGVIQGFRWSILGLAQPDWAALGISAAALVVILYGGLVYFARAQRTFADVL